MPDIEIVIMIAEEVLRAAMLMMFSVSLELIILMVCDVLLWEGKKRDSGHSDPE